ncbi:MAG: type IV pilus assembly protein PilM [Desulfobacteraceae bacterium]|jgi:type IV pilus assembly protein PilM
MPVPKKNQLVGLDIGSHSIKLVEIDDSKKGMILKNFGIVHLPKDTIVEGSIKEMEVAATAIRNLFKNLNVKNKNVATSISGFSVIVKKISITRRDEAALDSSIQEEAEQYIPFDISDVNLDYEILMNSDEEAGESFDEDENESGQDTELMDVMLVAAKKDIIEEYESLIHLAGLNPVVMDVDAFALQNAFEVSGDASGCYAIINIGAEELGINAIKNGISMFTRDSSYGGAQITDTISSQFDLSYEDAEKLKLGGTELEDKDKPALEEIFTTMVSGWVQETSRALDFLSTTYPEEKIEKIFVSGGACKIPDFIKYLELETGIPVEELNPFGGLQINEKIFDPKYLSDIAPQAGVAVGLALRSIGDK